MALLGEKYTRSNTIHHLRNPKNGDPQKELIRCLKFAAEAHKDQKRKDVKKTPYINHPIGVAYILSEEAGVTNLSLIQGCLLHDTVEDTPVTIEVIRAKFGDYIGDLVEEVTDDKSLPKQKRKDLQVIHAQTTSPQGKMVKLADKLYNLRDLERGLPVGWTEERRKSYFEWAFQVCEGLKCVSPELEEKLDEIFKKRGLISYQQRSKQFPETPNWPNHEELKPLIAAANFSAEKHSQHFVFNDGNNDPYINHLASVAFIVSQKTEIQNIPVLCAALLKDVIGKSGTKAEEIEEKFGKEVEQLVTGLTFDHSLPIKDYFSIQMSRVMHMSYNAKIITLASVIDNCQRLKLQKPAGWSQELQDNYFKWTFQLGSLLRNTHSQLDYELSSIKDNQVFGKSLLQSKEELHNTEDM